MRRAQFEAGDHRLVRANTISGVDNSPLDRAPRGSRRGLSPVRVRAEKMGRDDFERSSPSAIVPRASSGKPAICSTSHCRKAARTAAPSSRAASFSAISTARRPACADQAFCASSCSFARAAAACIPAAPRRRPRPAPAARDAPRRLRPALVAGSTRALRKSGACASPPPPAPSPRRRAPPGRRRAGPGPARGAVRSCRRPAARRSG